MARAHRSNLGEMLVVYRKRAGMSQADLALASGLSLSGICGIEQGRRFDPPWSVIQRLAFALELGFEELRTLNEKQLIRPAKQFTQSSA